MCKCCMHDCSLRALYALKLCISSRSHTSRTRMSSDSELDVYLATSIGQSMRSSASLRLRQSCCLGSPHLRQFQSDGILKIRLQLLPPLRPTQSHHINILK